MWPLLLLLISLALSDVDLPDSPLHHPQFIVPSACQRLRMNTFSVIVIVPLLDNEHASSYEWVLFIRADNAIWDFDIPPTPFTTITQIKPKSKTDSEYFSTLIFDLKDLDMPSFVHLTVRLLHKHNAHHNTSFGTTSIVIRITDQDKPTEAQHIRNLYQNAQTHAKNMNDEYAQLQSRYDRISNQYNENTFAHSQGTMLPKQWDDKHLTESFKHAVTNHDWESVLSTTDSNSVFKISNIFTSEFRTQMLKEIRIAKQLLENKEIELVRPNSMNNDGFVLKELGFGAFFDVFMEKWISQITASVYPFYLWCGESLDSLHGFTIRYAHELDKNLSRHMDQSQITFNLCLHNDDSVGSKVWFNGVRDNEDTLDENVSIALTSNEAIIHAGQHWHSTENIENGERINLILWFRSNYCRNSISEYVFDVCPNYIPANSVQHSEL